MEHDEDLYFPKQVIVNACAKNFTKLMDPYMKGLSISNCEKIRLEHNKFSKYLFFIINLFYFYKIIFFLKTRAFYFHFNPQGN